MLSRYKKKIHPRIGSALSGQFSPKEMATISRLGTIIEFSEGHTLYKQGTPSREAMLVLEGEVQIQRNERVIAQSSTGEFVGEVGLLHNDLRASSAVASSDIVALVMSAREFDSLLFLMPSLEASVTRTADSRLGDVIDLRPSTEPATPSPSFVAA